MITISASFFLLFFTLFPHHTVCNIPQESEPSDVITTTCAKTNYQNLCISSLKSYNTTESMTNDLHNLAQISLKIALSNATEINNQITEMQNKSSDKYIQQCLVDCSENYKDSVEGIESSVKSLESKDFAEVKTWVAAAMTNAQSCEDGFQGRKGYKSPLTRTNRIFSHLCSISLSITNLLVKS